MKRVASGDAPETGEGYNWVPRSLMRGGIAIHGRKLVREGVKCPSKGAGGEEGVGGRL